MPTIPYQTIKQDFKTALTSKYLIQFLIFFGLLYFLSICLFSSSSSFPDVFLTFRFSPFVFLGFHLDITLIKCLKDLKSQKSLYVSKFQSDGHCSSRSRQIKLIYLTKQPNYSFLSIYLTFISIGGHIMFEILSKTQR